LSILYQSGSYSLIIPNLCTQLLNNKYIKIHPKKWKNDSMGHMEASPTSWSKQGHNSRLEKLIIKSENKHGLCLLPLTMCINCKWFVLVEL